MSVAGTSVLLGGVGTSMLMSVAGTSVLLLAVLLLAAAAAAAAGGVVIADNWSSQRLGKRTLQTGQVLSVVACIIQFQ